MKFLILTMFLSHFVNTQVFADNKIKKEENIFNLTSPVKKAALVKENLYKVELVMFAAPYYADGKIFKCLEEAMNKKKAVNIKVTAQKLNIIECSVKK